MRLQGSYWKEGKFWLIEVPALDLMTQGETKKEALFMIQDAIEELIDAKDVKVDLQVEKNGEFSVGCNEARFLIALMLKRLRRAHNVIIQEVVDRLGVSSKNSYAQYEQAKSEPTTSKISQFLEAINPSLRVPVLL